MKWKIDFIRSDSVSYKNTSEYTCIVIADDSVTAVEIAKERVSKLDRQIKYDYCYYTCIDADNDNHIIVNDNVDTKEKIEQEIDKYLEHSYSKDAIDTGYNLQDLLLSSNNNDSKKKKDDDDGKSVNATTRRKKKIKLVILYTVLIVVTAMLSAGVTTVLLLRNK